MYTPSCVQWDFSLFDVILLFFPFVFLHIAVTFRILAAHYAIFSIRQFPARINKNAIVPKAAMHNSPTFYLLQKMIFRGALTLFLGVEFAHYICVFS